MVATRRTHYPSPELSEKASTEAAARETETTARETETTARETETTPRETEAPASETETTARETGALASETETTSSEIETTETETETETETAVRETETAQETSHEGGSQAHPIIIPDDGPSNKRKRRIAWGDPGFGEMWQNAQTQWPEIAAEWFASGDPELVAATAAFGQVMLEIEDEAVSRLNDAWKETERRLKGKRIILKFSRIMNGLESYSIRRVRRP